MKRMKKIAILATVLCALLLTACGGNAPQPVPTVTVTAEAPTPTAKPVPKPTPTAKQQLSDAQFLELVRKDHPVLLWEEDESIVGLAKSACGAFDRGASKEQVLDTVQGTVAMQEALAFTIGAGVVVYCPKYSDLLK